MAVKDFVAAGVQAKTIDPNLALLRVEQAPREGRELTTKAAARLESTRKIAIKCQCLQGAAVGNLLIATIEATPKAACGWFYVRSNISPGGPGNRTSWPRPKDG